MHDDEDDDDTQQPPLIGAEDVRPGRGTRCPPFDAPFALTPPENQTLDAAPRSLFDLEA